MTGGGEVREVMFLFTAKFDVQPLDVRGLAISSLDFCWD